MSFVENESILERKPIKTNIRRRFTSSDGVIKKHGTDKPINWVFKDAIIANEKGEKVFEQRNVEVPDFWSQTALNVVASKYFRTDCNGVRENSVKQLVFRVVDTIADWAIRGNYLTKDDATIFRDELRYMCINQLMAFNSPVWFNVGVEENPQASACFINSVEDTMESILDLAKTEGMLFKFGSGTGTNLSTIRSNKEPLRGGNKASGPVSFMRGYDSFAGVIKSGGKTRRAAKMVILNVDHPDIEEFIECKASEEQKAWALIDAGYDGGFNVPNGAYDSVYFQNANHSVRVSNDFMEAFSDNKSYQTKSVVDKTVVESLDATAIMQKIANAAHLCGDPGIQFDSIINEWHTCKNTDRINSSNPCSEYMFLDDSACNLASLNLMMFKQVSSLDNTFAVEDFKHAINMTILAQEIIVGFASYPTQQIAKNSVKFRPLGLGYANLGALLMSRGLPYDSNEGRSLAASITALMTGYAYGMSSVIADSIGPFKGFAENRESMLDVIAKHLDAARDILIPSDCHINNELSDLKEAAVKAWYNTYQSGKFTGFRNAQATVLAPTGTIGFMMDCDTTGVEPDIALVKYKKLVGGGYFKIVNNTVFEALNNLGYLPEEVDEICEFIENEGTIEGAPCLKDKHLPVFDCAFKAEKGTRTIEPMGHVRMMSAVQPFLSGAISKTVNMPADSTVEDILNVYVNAWHYGLKAVAIYRDGCKRTQPLSTTLDNISNKEDKAADLNTDASYILERKRLPDERPSITHKFSVGGHEGYITVGMYEDGKPGEVFIVMSKQGSTISGLMDSFATAISLGLQHGVPLESMIEKFSHTNFVPNGFTNNPNIRMAKSIPDYIFRWLKSKFLNNNEEHEKEKVVIEFDKKPMKVTPEQESYKPQSDSPPCTDCGSIMVRSGTCYKCVNCGSTSGCS